jgi:hypothetical protein
VSFYGELHVLGRDYLLSQHADPKTRERVPTVFVTPLQDFSGSTACGRIQWALQIVLRDACGMSAAQASIITKHSARKTIVSAAQAPGCPWEQCIELGHWAGTLAARPAMAVPPAKGLDEACAWLRKAATKLSRTTVTEVFTDDRWILFRTAYSFRCYYCRTGLRDDVPNPVF